MRLFMSAGFSNPMSPPFWDRVNRTSHGPRTGPACNDGAEWIARLVEDVLLNCLEKEAIFIVGGWEFRKPGSKPHEQGALTGEGRNIDLTPWTGHFVNQCSQIIHDWRRFGGLDENLWIEFGNELDLTGSWRKNLGGYHDAAMECYREVRKLSPMVKFITGSTSNFRKKRLPWQSRKGYETLKCLGEMDWPMDTLQGLHPYRTDLPQGEWHGYKSEEEALDSVLRVLKGRQVAITEQGWSSGPKFSDATTAWFMDDEIEMWKDFGAACYVHYQLQDGIIPDNTGEGGFGAYRNHLDGFAAKEVKPILEDWRGEL